MISRSRLYVLRHQWLQHKSSFQPGSSGGNHKPDWPPQARQFLAEILPHSQPLNFALLADELDRRFHFQRSRAVIAAYVRQHFSQRVPRLKPGPKPRRRWQCAAIGELWQHDSSPHPWWPAEHYPTLILTLDDHSRKILGGTFVPSDTTWSHFVHLRALLEKYGLPACLYTDGLSLFGHRTPADRLDTHSQFQRAFTAMGVNHRVAPDAQAKGKIERRFQVFQKRLVTLLAYEKIADYSPANLFLQTQIDWHNNKTRCRTTRLTPNEAWEKAQSEKRSRILPIPPTPLLDLHLALHIQRRLNSDNTLDFLGRSWPISHTKHKFVTLIHHPHQCFWVVPSPPNPKNPAWPNVLAHHSL
ncbi:MAG: hypothetical protein KGR98_03725 [Verrucomicrobia bacterium]|nr:hypothetical protein [Verrucomicrobiota bacterium]